MVVWEDERNGDCDIYGYNLGSKEEFQITTDPGSQCAPAICKNIVVWSDYRQGYGNSDVFGYDLNTGKEFQITTDRDEQDDVAIYNNIVVWEDERGVNGDVLYGYNLETKEEFRVHKSYWYFILEMSQHNPAIFEDTVVWTTGLDYEIYGYNMSTSKEVKIAVAQKVPCIPGKNCIQVRPAIHSNIVVWADTRNGNSDIYGHDLDAGEELRITTNPEDQYSPAIYGNVVAWTDRRNGRGDIYCCDISAVPRSRPSAVPREVLHLFAGVVALAVIVLMVRKKESKLRAQ
jgi:TolB protein